MANQNDVVKVVAKLKGGFGDDIVNVWYCRVSDAGLGSMNDLDVYDAIAEWLETMYSEINSSISSQVAYHSIDLHNITQNYPMAVGVWPTLSTGAGAGDRLPAGTAALLLGRTTVNRVVAKKYLPNFTEGALVGGVWGSAVLTDMTSMGTIWRTPYLALNAIVVEGGVWRDAVNLFTGISSVFASPEPAYQRRRRPGRGS